MGGNNSSQVSSRQSVRADGLSAQKMVFGLSAQKMVFPRRRWSFRAEDGLSARMVLFRADGLSAQMELFRADGLSAQRIQGQQPLAHNIIFSYAADRGHRSSRRDRKLCIRERLRIYFFLSRDTPVHRCLQDSCSAQIVCADRSLSAQRVCPDCLRVVRRDGVSDALSCVFLTEVLSSRTGT